MSDCLIETPLVLEIRRLVKEFERTYPQKVASGKPVKTINRSYMDDGNLVISSKTIYSSEATVSVQMLIDLIDQFLSVNQDLMLAAQKTLGWTFMCSNSQTRAGFRNELRFIVKAHKYLNDVSAIPWGEWLKDPTPELPRRIGIKLRDIRTFIPAAGMSHKFQSDDEGWAKTMEEIESVPMSCLEYPEFIEKIHAFGFRVAPKMSLRSIRDAYKSMSKFLLTHGRRGYSEMGDGMIIDRSVFSPAIGRIFDDTPENGRV